MATAEELLASLLDESSTHEHPVIDTDTHFVINTDTRQITNDANYDIVLMQYDHNSERYTFELPRYIDGHDMLLCNRVRVHFNNIDGETGVEIIDVAEMTDLAVNPDDSSTVMSSWVITRQATQLVGNLSFLVQYMCVSDTGVVTYEWHTDIFSDVQVKRGRNNDEAAVVEYSNILEEWYQKLFGAGDSVVADIIATADEQKAAVMSAIESKGEEVLATIPEDYTTTYNMANDALRTRANAIVETVEGSAIVETDCSDDYLRGMRLFGKSTQVRTTGVQLLDFDPYVSGLVATSAYCHVAVNTNPFATAGRYYYSCSGTFGTSYKIWAYDTSDNLIINASTGVIEVTEEQASTITRVSIVVQGVSSGTAYTGYIYPMINAGTTALPWEPYSGGVASPSPDYVQEITSIENPTVSLAGANLLKNNYQTVTKHGVSVTAPGDGTLVFSGTATDYFGVQANTEIYLPDGIYFLSGAANGLVLTIWGQTSSGWKSIAVDNGKGVVFEANGDRYPYYLAQYSVEKDRSYDVIVYPMINAGNNAFSWETYKELQTFTLTKALRGIPVDSDGNYTDENGQQWICDEIDFERGVYIQRVKECIISGTPNFQETSNWAGRFIWDCLFSDLANGLNVCYCNFACWSEWGMDNNKDGRDYGSVSGANLYYTPATTMTADEVNAEFAAMIASDTPPVIVAQLATPIETALTDEELFTFSQLHSNYPTATILNDQDMHMEVSYNADTQIYLERLPKVPDSQVEAAVDAWLTAHYATAEEASF